MKIQMSKKWSQGFFIILGLFFVQGLVYAQLQPTPVQCGSIVEAEFSIGNTKQEYTINLEPGDKLYVKTERLGDLMDIDSYVYDSVGNEILRIQANGPTQEGTTPTLSARGSYRTDVYEVGKRPGIYTLYIGCTLRDGTVISPGDAPRIEQPVLPTAIPTAPPGFRGFPGLAPIDFTNGVLLPLNIGATNNGSITPGFDGVFGFTIDAAANDTLALSFTRLSGNLNLGLVVLSADNKVVFQASLVTSSELTTTFTLPSAGQYTIGVFRIDLLPPASPEPTAFQLQATLNP